MSTPSKVRRWIDAMPMSARSCFNVERLTIQPRPRVPTMLVAGTRTLSKNTSLKSASPVIWRSGRTSRPGVVMSISMYVMPSCFGLSGSVRTSANIQSASAAFDVQILWPFTTQ
jgi:hypothetical protein